MLLSIRSSRPSLTASVWDLDLPSVLPAIGIVRELIGAGTIFGVQVMPSVYQPITIFILAPGAFLVLSLLTAASEPRETSNAGKR